MNIHSSALKHGIDPDDSLHAAASPVYRAWLDDDSPSRELLLGFDRQARLLEIVVLTFDSGDQLVIHSMRARRQYYDLLQG
ncbi:hypothetical protein [Nocardioides alkalitolerans]|uniref:hypothetical protein n=1 Tax=Nocardioides alkalitolerans TaxID=281714 RepID=UPI000420624E|nr:hypothetical protein [Nocardioides alkalitolerans]